MYMPFLRGKQFELLALKEYAARLGESGQVTPIIEPIRPPDGALDRCLSALHTNGVGATIIANPKVGSLAQHGPSEPILEYAAEHHSITNWTFGLIIDETTDVGRLIDEYRTLAPPHAHLCLVHYGVTHDSDQLRTSTADLHRIYDVVADSLRARHFRPYFSTSQGILLHDGFEPEDRNAGYLTRTESQFTEDHLYYREEGWGGFADYLTIGSRWTEGGFTPRAVAIHWTYQPTPTSPVLIRHFTSESNEDTSNVGGKFLEACDKLVAFLDAQELHGTAANAMRSYAQARAYPGLGMVKKLSIQNHLELMVTIQGRNP